ITNVNSCSVIITLLSLAVINRPPNLLRMIGWHSRRRPDPHQTVVSFTLTHRLPPRMPRSWRFDQPTVSLGELQRFLDLLFGMTRSTCHVDRLQQGVAICQRHECLLTVAIESSGSTGFPH